MRVSSAALRELMRLGLEEVTLRVSVYCCDIVLEIVAGRGEMEVFSSEKLRIYLDSRFPDMLKDAMLDYQDGFVLSV
ncbi:hypothetical protein [Geoglobus sp.]